MKKIEFNIQESFGFHFISIAVAIKKLMEDQLKQYDLTHLQFSILMNLHKNKITTQKEMLKYIYGDEASITRLVDRLECKGYIKRVQCKNDRRKKNIILTESGITLTEKVIPYAVEVNKELTKGLEKDEADTLLGLLQKVHASADEAP